MESPGFNTAQEVSLTMLLPVKSRGLNDLWAGGQSFMWQTLKGCKLGRLQFLHWAGLDAQSPQAGVYP